MPPGPQLSIDKILDAAIQIADRDGLEAVSMRRLAADLSVTPMALYWHVANRPALVDAMAARVVGGAWLPPLADESWEEQLQIVLGAVVGVLRSHRWMSGIASTRYVRDPAYLRIVERLIGALRRAGLDTETAVAVLDVSVDWLVAVVAGEVEPCDPDPELVAYFDSLEDFPNIRAASRTMSAPTPDRARIAISMIIDGVRARAAAPTL